MPDLFSGMVPDASRLFDGVPMPTSIENPQGTLGRFRRAQIAAVANLNIDDTPAEAIYDQFQKLASRYEQNIQMYGEGQAENAAAARRMQNRAQGLIDLSNDIGPSAEHLGVSAAISQATTETLQYDMEQAREAALEQAAVDRIVDLSASGAHTTAAAYLNLMEHGDVLQQRSDFMTKQLILQREMDRYQAQREAQPWFAPVVNLATDIFLSPLNTLSKSGLRDIPEDQKGLMDWIWPGDRQRAEAASMWDLSPEEFGRVMREELLPRIDEKSSLFFNMWQDNSEARELLDGIMHTPRPVINNFWSTLDTVGLLGASEVVAGGRIVRSIPSVLSGMGARRAAAAMTARAARDGALNDVSEALMRTGFETKDDIAEALSPDIILPQTGPVRVTGWALANDMLERADGIAEGLNALVQTGRFANEAELLAARQAFLERELVENFEEAQVMNIDWSDPARLIDNSSFERVTFTLGKTKTEGHVTEAAARRFADRTGFADAAVEQIEGGQWVVKVTRAMPESGAYIDPLQVKTTNIFSRYLLGARQRSDDFLANRAQVSENTRNTLLNDLRAQLWRDVNIDPASKARVAQMAAFGESKGAWFENLETANMFYQRSFRRDITEREWKSYNGLRDINDFDYGIRNDARYKELQLRGLETVNVDTGFGYIEQANAFIDEGMTRAVRGRVLNMSDGSIVNDLDEASRVTLRDKGYQLVHLDEPFKLADGREITAVATRKGQHFQREGLRRAQLPYRAGGHRIYEDKYFVKQAHRTTLDNGDIAWKNPNTYVAGTKAEVQEWADVMNLARRQYELDAGDLNKIDQIFGGRPGYPTAEQFVKGIADGTYSKDFDFVPLFDRELPREYDNVGRQWMTEEAEDGTLSYLRTNGRLYYSQKGNDALVDFRGAQAPVLDAYESVNRAFLNIANLSSFGDYKVTAVNRWFNTFDRYIDKTLLPKNYTPMQAFLDGKLTKGASRDKVTQAAEDQRQIILRNLGWKTEADMKYDEVGRSFAEFMMGHDPRSARHGISRKVINWVSDKNPLQSLRGFAFDLKLGLFNPVQLFLQAGTFMAIAAIDPSMLTKVVPSNTMLRGYLIREDFLKTYIKTGMWKTAGFETVDEFEAFMKTSKASGFLTINESHSLVNSLGPNSGLSLSDNPLQKISETGRFFFNEGELINRMAAMRSAWDYTKRQFPDLDNARGEDFMNVFTGRAETMAFSMSRSSQAWWQQGLSSIPTQFFSYQARMMEMMFGGQLTRFERAKLIASQIVLYGAAGVPLAPVVSDLIAQREGKAQQLGTLGGYIDRGGIDNIVNALTGVDVMIGERFGTGGWIGDTIGELMGYSKYGEQNTMDVIGGASFAVASDVFTDLKPYLTYMLAESGGQTGRVPTERHFINLANNISTVSNVLKFMMIRNHGQYVSTSGNVSVDEVPSDAAWFVLLTGSKPGSMDELAAQMSYLKNRDAVVKEAARVIEQYRAELFNRPDDHEEIADEINIFVRHLDPSIRASVLAKARQPSRSMLDSAEERINRIRSQEAALRATEESQ